MEGIAIVVRKLDGFRGDARLYRLNPPLEGWDGQAFEYVIVSAANVPNSGPETYIFGATPTGEIAEWLNLHGSFQGALDHERALRGAGYRIVEQAGGEE